MKHIDLVSLGQKVDPTKPLKLKIDAEKAPFGYKVTVCWNRESKLMDRFPDGMVFNNVELVEWMYDNSVFLKKKPILHLDAPKHNSFAYKQIDKMLSCKIEVQKKLEKAF